MQVDQKAFAPLAGGTVNIAASTTTGAVQIQSANNITGRVRVYNSGASVPVFIDFGASTITASLTHSMPIPAGQSMMLACAQEYAAAIWSTTTGAGTVYFTPGDGTS